jgi:rRNA maturation endonuclease Nob1
VELLCEAQHIITNTSKAKYLIEQGVTVQEEAKLYWKPVKPGEWNLTCSACDSHLGCREDANFCPECGAKFVYPKAVAPQPPKGE